jgi:hypothetical protein
MKRVIIVPVTETDRFPGMEILARGGSIAALVGDTFEGRFRSAFDSEDSFFYSACHGQADLYTFNTSDEAARFAKGKIETLMTLELSIKCKANDLAGALKIARTAVPSPERRRKRADLQASMTRVLRRQLYSCVYPRACNKRQVYAESILKVCEFCIESPLPCVSGITGADLKKRVV